MGGGIAVNGFAARKYVHCCIPVFRPCMYGKVGLRDNDHPTDPLRSELVKKWFNNCCAGLVDRIYQYFFDMVLFIQDVRITII